MKTLKLIFLLTFLSLNAHAARLSEEEKVDVKRQLDELIAETKDQDGFVTMDKFNAMAFQSLESFHANRKMTREELIKFKEMLEGIRVKAAAKDREAQIRDLFDKNLLKMAQGKEPGLIAEGQICNDWDCEKGLECAPVPPRLEKGGQCKSGDMACNKDSECCSGECVTGDDGKKACEFTFRCYRPVAQDKSCLENPVCGKGSCEEIFFADANIGACVKNGVSCKSNVDCCSDSCEKGKCVENYRCRDCISSGKLERGQKCCEDKAMEQDGKCVPINIPLNPFVDVLKQTLDFVFPAAQASSVDITLNNGQDDSGSSNTTNLRNYVEGQGQNINPGSGLGGQELAENHGEMAKLMLATDAGSNFDTCEINLLNDHVKKLRGTSMVGSPGVSMLEVELALLGFEFVATGSSQIQDYWKGGSSNKSLNERVRQIADKRRDRRLAFYGDLQWFQPKIKCLCLEKTGWKEMTAEQKTYYKDSCRLGKVIPEMSGDTTEAALLQYRATRDDLAAQQAPSQAEWDAYIAGLIADENNPNEGNDAAGLKGLQLLEAWASANARIEEVGLVLASLSMDELDDVHHWMQTEAKWNQPSETKQADLYKFEIQNPAMPSNPALLVALLSAGAVAIIGGIVAPASWVAFGVISVTAMGLGAGVWVTSSLRGAWFSKAPEVQDHPLGNSYKCGKNDGENCQQFTRKLTQPYNSVCGRYISSNACIKHFIVDKSDNGHRMLVDPWIPHGLSQSEIIKDSRDFSVLLNDGYQRALTLMKTPPSTQFGIKGSKQVDAWRGHGSLMRYGSEQLERTAITANVLAKYAPALRNNANDYIVQTNLKNKIIQKAGQYLKDQGFVTSEAELQRFGEYVYANHFVWSKASYADVLAYPQPGFVSYIGLIANGLAANTETSAVVASGYSNMQAHYANQQNLVGGIYKDEGTRVEIASGGQQGIGGGANQVGLGDSFGISGFGGASALGGAGASGSLSGGGLGDGNFDSSLFDAGVNDAIAKLRKVRARQKANADAFKKAMGSSERGKRMVAAAAKFRDDFYKGSMGNANNIGASTGGLGNLLGSTGSSATGGGDANNGENDAATGAKSSLFSDGVGRTGGGRDGGGGYGSGGSSAFNQGVSGSGGLSPEDARRLNDAIKNRDNNADKYQRQDGMSLWEIVTNTYIRVYDRLLERKKNDLD